MNLRGRRDASPEMNLTPLIDVVFLLLIFFMVSTTFDRTSELSIELPEASLQDEQEPEDLLEVSIDSQGRHYVNGQRLVNSKTATVREALRKAAGRLEYGDGRGDPPPVVVHADAKAPHQSVVTVMDAARQLGLVRLSFATQSAPSR